MANAPALSSTRLQLCMPAFTIKESAPIPNAAFFALTCVLSLKAFCLLLVVSEVFRKTRPEPTGLAMNLATFVSSAIL